MSKNGGPSLLAARSLVIRLVIVTALPGLGGCFIFGWGSDREIEPRELPDIEYSPGFFAEFDQMMDETTARGSLDEQARTLDGEFAAYLEDGPGQDEVYAVGTTWEKVEAFLEIGLLSAEIMDPITGSERNQVDIFGNAADRVLRSDVAAIDAWNQTALDMGFNDAAQQITGDIVGESLYLVLTESEQAYRQVWVESSEWVEGYWARSEGYYEQLWVEGYYDVVWQDGACYDDYVGTDCDSYWVDDSCHDVWVDDGYWDTYCSYYDEWGNCIEWSDEWVDTGYYETYCDSGYYAEDCYDVYDTVCEEGQWVDVWVDGYYVQGAWIPGELYWVEGYWADTSGYQTMALPEQEAEILAAGIGIVTSLGPERVGEACFTELDEAVQVSSDLQPEVAAQTLRDAVLDCLSPR